MWGSRRGGQGPAQVGLGSWMVGLSRCSRVRRQERDRNIGESRLNIVIIRTANH